MSTGHESEPATRLAEASRVARAELDKQGTPDYDPRAHERAVEFERKAAEALRAQRQGTS